jgi:predicted PurR-regulated permease PerM
MERGVPTDNLGSPSRDQLTATWVELSIRIGVLVLLLYWTFTLVRPFVTIAIWSAVLTVALYPVYDWMVFQLGGRRRLAAVVLTLLSLLIVIGPTTWLVLGLVDGVESLSQRLEPSALTLPEPPATIKSWPLVGDSIYQFWDLASRNLGAALGMVVPQLKPLGSAMLVIAAEAGSGMIKFFLAIIVAGFLFSPGPLLLDAVRRFSRRVASARGEEFVRLAGATIRSVSRGVIGISVLQALLAGVGLLVAGIPGASLITFAVLILGIIQIGPSIILIPLIIWAWISMETSAALLFTAYMMPVNLLDNILRPLVMGHGLTTPMPIILLGVIGGTISYGITGLFLGPIVLAVFWELLSAWLRESESAQ